MYQCFWSWSRDIGPYFCLFRLLPYATQSNHYLVLPLVSVTSMLPSAVHLSTHSTPSVFPIRWDPNLLVEFILNLLHTQTRKDCIIQATIWAIKCCLVWVWSNYLILRLQNKSLHLFQVSDISGKCLFWSTPDVVVVFLWMSSCNSQRRFASTLALRQSKAILKIVSKFRSRREQFHLQ